MPTGPGVHNHIGLTTATLPADHYPAIVTHLRSELERERASHARNHDQAEYDRLPVKTKIGIVCAPDNTTSTDIGIPYMEMEPSDEEFYGPEQTVYTRSFVGRREITVKCIFMFCLKKAKLDEATAE